jgi:hypothetical protein
MTMRITKRMDLSALARLIAPEATEGDARIVRDALVRGGYTGGDTNVLPESVWMRVAYQSPTA